MRKAIVLALICILSSCEEDVTDYAFNENLSEIVILKNTLKFQSNDVLNNFLDKEKNYNFKSSLVDFRKKGFKPLRPIFHSNNDFEIDQFLAKKKNRLVKKNNLLYKYNENDDDLDLDDELIADDSFASILN